MPSSIQASSVKGWRGEDATVGKASLASFEDPKQEEYDSYDTESKSNDSSSDSGQPDLDNLNILM